MAKWFAGVAELADALDLGSSGESRAGSSPVIRIQKKYRLKRCFFCFTDIVFCCIVKL